VANVATRNFIVMCLQAEEVQKRRQITLGNRYFDRAVGGVYTVGNSSGKLVFNIYNENIRDRVRFIWIPSMLQMQDIYWHFLTKQNLYTKERKPAFIMDLSLYLGNFSMINAFADVKFWSLEEVLLAVLMMDMYDKQWNGREFLEIKKKKKKRKKKKDKDEDSKHS